MAKRGYKLQEFVAHTTNVNCLSIGKKACRLLITGGDDQKVNLWAIGKPTSLMSLCGHTSPIDSVAFDSAEVLVVAGASSGVIKLWDLEEAKMVRGLTGHRSNCTAVEFHPFGEFFASGSMDTNLKIWDIRKKGCIHTYKGHTRGVSTIRFTPDGRWVVSGGFDNVVKVWDLTAGKLLHDFKFHEGHIRSLDFHPLEFLLATGSADRTVKFWDLETFELIGSSRPEAMGVRSITFHPDGRTLFSGLDDGLKVYSWEPVICHDSVDMGWSTLGDLCINEGKLLSCSYYQNSVGVWVADISLIEPYGAGFSAKKEDSVEKKFNLQGTHSSEKLGSHMRSTSTLCRMSPDYETKEIKNIYIDSSGGKPAVSLRAGSLNSPKVVDPLDSEEISNLTAEKQSVMTGVHAKSTGQAVNKSFIVPSIVPRDSPVGKDSSNPGRESISFSKTKPGMLLRPAHVRRPSHTKYDVERLSVAVESGALSAVKSEIDSGLDPKLQNRLVSEDGATRPSDGKDSDIKTVTETFEKVLPPQTPSDQLKSEDSSKETNSVRFVNGVAVVPGRTRTLVERFERREISSCNEDKAVNMTPNRPTNMTPNQANNVTLDQATSMTPTQPTYSTPHWGANKTPNQARNVTPDQATSMTRNQPSYPTPDWETNKTPSQPTNMTYNVIPEIHRTPTLQKVEPQISRRESISANDGDVSESLMQSHDVFLSTLRSRLTKLQVVRHFWERNDIKGAIGALRKLPDHSVQADVISVLMEKMEILTLDLFSCLLPVLTGLLDSKIERHSNVSLEMLLKLVAVFGPVIRSTISAPRAVGVDLHAEQRLECCKQCFLELQKIQKILPVLIRRGGLMAKKAQELNLVLQEP